MVAPVVTGNSSGNIQPKQLNGLDSQLELVPVVVLVALPVAVVVVVVVHAVHN